MKKILKNILLHPFIVVLCFILLVVIGSEVWTHSEYFKLHKEEIQSFATTPLGIGLILLLACVFFALFFLYSIYLKNQTEKSKSKPDNNCTSINQKTDTFKRTIDWKKIWDSVLQILKYALIIDGVVIAAIFILNRFKFPPISKADMPGVIIGLFGVWIIFIIISFIINIYEDLK